MTNFKKQKRGRGGGRERGRRGGRKTDESKDGKINKDKMHRIWWNL